MFLYSAKVLVKKGKYWLQVYSTSIMLLLPILLLYSLVIQYLRVWIHRCQYNCFLVLLGCRNTYVNNVLVMVQWNILFFNEWYVIVFVLFSQRQMLWFLVAQLVFDCSETLQRVECKLTSVDWFSNALAYWASSRNGALSHTICTQESFYHYSVNY